VLRLVFDTAALLFQTGSHGVNPVLNRGDRRELIFLDDEDRQRFVATLGEVFAGAS
jgi:hypothetical protein